MATDVWMIGVVDILATGFELVSRALLESVKKEVDPMLC